MGTHAVGGAGSRVRYRPEDAGNVILRNGLKGGGDCIRLRSVLFFFARW